MGQSRYPAQKGAEPQGVPQRQPGAVALDAANGVPDDDDSDREMELMGSCLLGACHRGGRGSRRPPRRAPRQRAAVGGPPWPADGEKEIAPGESIEADGEGHDCLQAVWAKEEEAADSSMPAQRSPVEPQLPVAHPEAGAGADSGRQVPRAETEDNTLQGSFLGLAKRGKPATDADKGGILDLHRDLESEGSPNGSSAGHQDGESPADANGTAVAPTAAQAGRGDLDEVSSASPGFADRPAMLHAVASRSPFPRRSNRRMSDLGTNPMHRTFGIDHTTEPDGLALQAKERRASDADRTHRDKSKHTDGGVRNQGYYKRVPGMLPPRPIPEVYGVPRFGIRSACSSPMVNPAFGSDNTRWLHGNIGNTTPFQVRTSLGNATPQRVHYAYGNATPLRMHGTKPRAPGLPPRPHMRQYGCDTAHFYAPMASDGPRAQQQVRLSTPRLQAQRDTYGADIQGHVRQSPLKESAARADSGSAVPGQSTGQTAIKEPFPALFLANSHEHSLHGAWGSGGGGRAMELSIHSDGLSLSSEDLLMNCSSSSDGSPRADFRIPTLDLNGMHDSEAGNEKEVAASRQRIACFTEGN